VKPWDTTRGAEDRRHDRRHTDTKSGERYDRCHRSPDSESAGETDRTQGGKSRKQV
jgi:hypothetical protein